MLSEISKEAAILLIEGGSGYWSPQCHTPTPGVTDTTVVYLCGKFYGMPKAEFSVKVHKVLHFDQSSMIVSHAIQCNNDELSKIMVEEMRRIAQQTKHERWAQTFIEQSSIPTAVTPRQGRHWHNRFIVEPVDTGSPPDAN